MTSHGFRVTDVITDGESGCRTDLKAGLGDYVQWMQQKLTIKHYMDAEVCVLMILWYCHRQKNYLLKKLVESCVYNFMLQLNKAVSIFFTV